MKTMTPNIKESQLAKSKKRAFKGVRGFAKSENPKKELVAVRVTTETKDFLETYCKKYEITKTQLILAALEWYSGFNGANGEQIMNNKKLKS
jgi:hypothetical protein